MRDDLLRSLLPTVGWLLFSTCLLTGGVFLFWHPPREWFPPLRFGHSHLHPLYVTHPSVRGRHGTSHACRCHRLGRRPSMYVGKVIIGNLSRNCVWRLGCFIIVTKLFSRVVQRTWSFSKQTVVCRNCIGWLGCFRIVTRRFLKPGSNVHGEEVNHGVSRGIVLGDLVVSWEAINFWFLYLLSVVWSQIRSITILTTSSFDHVSP